MRRMPPDRMSCARPPIARGDGRPRTHLGHGWHLLPVWCTVWCTVCGALCVAHCAMHCAMHYGCTPIVQLMVDEIARTPGTVRACLQSWYL